MIPYYPYYPCCIPFCIAIPTSPINYCYCSFFCYPWVSICIVFRTHLLWDQSQHVYVLLCFFFNNINFRMMYQSSENVHVYVLSCFNMCHNMYAWENHALIYRWASSYTVHECQMVISASSTLMNFWGFLVDELDQPMATCSAKPDWFDATGFASINCSHNIWSETIVRTFTNLWPLSPLNSRRHSLAIRPFHSTGLVSGLHLELKPGSENNTGNEPGTRKCLQENTKRRMDPLTTQDLRCQQEWETDARSTHELVYVLLHMIIWSCMGGAKCTTARAALSMRICDNLRKTVISRNFWIFAFKGLHFRNHSSYELELWHVYSFIILLQLQRILSPPISCVGRASKRVDYIWKSLFYAALWQLTGLL